MKAFILSARAAHDSAAPIGSLVEVVAERARAHGYAEVLSLDVTDEKLAFCQGDFDCWVRHPGRCKTEDREQEIVAHIHDADAVFVVDELTFGGHGYPIKRAIDRVLCLISPYFTTRAALTHHEPRYARMPAWVSIGWASQRDDARAETYESLADANALNLLAPMVAAATVTGDDPRAFTSAIDDALARLRAPGSGITTRDLLRAELLSAAQPDPQPPPAPPRTAAVIVGSAKPKGTSASELMVQRLAGELARGGVDVQLHFATEFVHDNARTRALARELASAELLVLATPLYIDSLPALATHALQLIAAARCASPTPAAFALLINCGFPEPEHNRTALRIGRHFAADARYRFAGALPLGGGGVVSSADALDGAACAHIREALAVAGEALARGDAIPERALAAITTRPMPDWSYRAVGDLTWRYQAHRAGTPQRALRARPLDRQ